MKLKLLAIEHWALGDLVVATPFLRVASQQFHVTLLAKPIAAEMQPRLWPEVEVIPCEIPWTRFRGKYDLTRWPWRDLKALVAKLRDRRFDIGVAARWDPRDHFLLRMSRVRRRVGFPRLCSGLFLTDKLRLPPSDAHRYENWRLLGHHLGMELPSLKEVVPTAPGGGTLVIHSGAAQPTRVWPLERFKFLADQSRSEGYAVEIICDAPQRDWWIGHGERVRTPGTIQEFMAILDDAGLFVGNDSGPGHLAGILGVPTFTLFGNQFPNRFVPLDGPAEWIEGGECVYKPCYDTCRFARPECLLAIRKEEAWRRLKTFAAKHLNAPTMSK